MKLTRPPRFLLSSIALLGPSLVGLSLVGLSQGCGDDASPVDGGSEVDAGNDAPESMPLDGCPDGTCFFVAERIDVPLVVDEMSPGRNVDGLASMRGDSTGCGQQDWSNPRTGESGVDNQLAVLVPPADAFLNPSSVSEFLEGVIADGRLALLLKLEGADGTEDDQVDVTVYRGAVPAGRLIALDDDGTIAADQTFDIDLMLLDPVMVQGEIRGGRLFVELPEVTLPIVISGVLLTLRGRDAVISATIVEGGLVDGEMSGRLNIAEVAETLAPSAGGIDVAALLADSADLNPDALGDCQDISAAIVFDGITAIEGVTY